MRKKTLVYKWSSCDAHVNAVEGVCVRHINKARVQLKENQEYVYCRQRLESDCEARSYSKKIWDHRTPGLAIHDLRGFLRIRILKPKEMTIIGTMKHLKELKELAKIHHH